MLLDDVCCLFHILPVGVFNKLSAYDAGESSVYYNAVLNFDYERFPSLEPGRESPRAQVTVHRQLRCCVPQQSKKRDTC